MLFLFSVHHQVHAATLADLFVPVVLSSSGMNGSFFTSELSVTNRDSNNATLEFDYTAAVGGGSGSATALLDAGKQLVVPDAISYLIGLGIPIPASGSRVGTLRVRISGIANPNDASVMVRTTTAVAGGRAGLAYAGVPQQQGLQGIAYLCGLRQTSTDRTNVAFQNMGTATDGNITLVVTVYSGIAGNSASTVLPDIILTPGEFNQINGVLQSNGLMLTNGYVKIERISGTAPYYAYAVINDQVTSDGSFVPPVLESPLTAQTGLTLPVVVETGAFTSELVVTNASIGQKNVQLSYSLDSTSNPVQQVSVSRNLQPGEQWIQPNFVQYLRDSGLAGQLPQGPTYAGPLMISALGGDVSGLFAGVRTSSPGGGGQFGVFYPAIADGASSPDTAWVYGLQQNAENRSNLALVVIPNQDANPDTFSIDLYDGNTGLLAQTINGLSVAARGWMQEGLILNQAPGVSQGYAHIRRAGGLNRFITYGVINDGGAPGQRTGDGAFLTSQPGEVASNLGFVSIPAGVFQMGSINSKDSQPVHSVTISRSFEMMSTHVVQSHWVAEMGTNPSLFNGCSNCPVEQVSWEDAQVFIQKLNGKKDGYTYRLPTEAEWEYAARAGTTGNYGGTGVLDNMGWYSENGGGVPQPDGLMQPNAWGLYDMHGNVFEWCQDWYDASYYAVSPATDPPGPATGTLRVARGGSIVSPASSCTSASRGGFWPIFRDGTVGLRLVRTVSP
jgi:formylglycine-generating enzyme required for sulfatase activity